MYWVVKVHTLALIIILTAACTCKKDTTSLESSQATAEQALQTALQAQQTAQQAAIIVQQAQQKANLANRRINESLKYNNPN